EYVPIALILLLLMEWSGEVPPWTLHFLGLTLLVGRLLHGVGLNQTDGISRGRFIGTLLTWSMLLIGSGLALGMSIGRLI
ncbi:MAG: MAPEG family protein, partial [Xanthomonadaceae bacterium]|nr:MAPEG family protein [Xanthomonadaceae bacterium]